MNTQRKILVTSALIYANGPVHLGHLVEYIQTDIWVRFQKMRGHTCHYICGSDAHGTPITIKAEQLKMDPEQMVTQMSAEQQRDFAAFGVNFDYFYTTHSEENRELSALIYGRLQLAGSIKKRVIFQAFDPIKNMFLPDRYVKGTCPKCRTENQYGDSCEQCGATYSPTELINPVSVISGATPIQRESEHFFFDLPAYESMLKEWAHAGHLQTQIVNKLEEWFKTGLQQWDISRDAPYFGFQIPGEKDKYFYVWLDAPIGYMASFKKFCQENKEVSFDEFWSEENNTELYHFVGKDIIYFHALFWPAMLKGAKFRLPTAIFAHGFLTVNGQKMSKSRGTFINARHYLNHLNPEYLRYYYAAKLSSHIDDIDLNFEDFTFRVNSDLVGKIVNIASRCAGFITKQFDGMLAATCDNKDLFDTLAAQSELIADLYDRREYASAVREIMQLADKANQYIDEKKPWTLAKQTDTQAQVQAICSLGINLFYQLMIYLKPILPVMAREVESFLNVKDLTWQSLSQPLLNHKINGFKPLMQRVEAEKIQALLTESAQ